MARPCEAVRESLFDMPLNLRTVRRCCFVGGAGLLIWTSAEFFILAFLTSQFMVGAGVLLWMQGYLVALVSSPTGIAGAFLLLVSFFLRRT